MPYALRTEHDAREWQVAMEALLIIAEHGGPTMFARIGMMRALNWHIERVFESSGKKTHWGSESWRGDLSPIAEVRY